MLRVSVLRPQHSLLLWLVFVAAVLGTSQIVFASAAFRESSAILLAALLIDFAVVIPSAYWLLLARRRIVPRASTVGVALLSVALFTLVVPDSHDDSLHVLRVALPVVELAVIAAVAFHVTAMVRSYAHGPRGADLLEDLERVLTPSLGTRAAEVMSSEVAVFVYALSRRAGERRPAGSSFSYRAAAGIGPFVAGFVIVLAVEALPVHLLISRWSATAAWIITGLTAYSALWLIADWRASALRPVAVNSRELILRVGLRWTARVDLSNVAGVTRLSGTAWARRVADDLVNLTAPAVPHLEIVFHTPVKLRGPLGISRSATRVGLRLDDRLGFERQMAGALGSGERKARDGSDGAQP